MALTCERLSKTYGRTRVLDDVSFMAPDGMVSCLVGRNGAGKTTTIKALLGLITPDGGKALIDSGRQAGGTGERGRAPAVGVAFGPEFWMGSRTGRQSLRAMALATGTPWDRVNACLERVGLAHAASKRVRTYSMGMRQRLSIAAALLCDADNLILDEPFVGLDPEGVRWLGRLLRGLADEGRAVLVSSHLLAELESVGDRVIVLKDGAVAAQAEVASLRDRGGTIESFYFGVVGEDGDSQDA